MIEDFDKCTGNATYAADVCIVGGGAAGITLSRDLAKSGLDVCLLESGGLDYDARIQELARGTSCGYTYYDLEESRLRFFGGTTSIWGGRCAQLDRIDFERRPWVEHSGWPFGKDAIAPYYARAQRDFDLAEMDGSDAAWKEHGLGRPPFDRDEIATSFWQFDLAADRFAQARCRDVIDSPKIKVVLHATVINIQANADGTAIDRLDIANLRGGRGEARGKIYVLAAGGLEVPRLLLASNGVHPNGLGNGYDVAGRYFMEHPHARGGHIVTTDVWTTLRLLPRSYSYRGHRYAALARPGEALQRREGALNSSFTISARQPPDEKMTLTKHVYMRLRKELNPNRGNRILWHLNRRFLLAAREFVGPHIGWSQVKRGSHGLYMVVRAEQAPNPQSRVVLSDERDSLGMRRLVLDWRMSPIDKRTVQVATGALDRELKRMGLGRVERVPWLEDDGPLWQSDPLVSNHPIGGFHHMGTTRMGQSPRDSVVDADCRVHGIGNLYIAGSSVFPTSGWANPTMTILALAHRLGDHLTARWKAFSRARR